MGELSILIDRTGETNVNYQGSCMTIIHYNNAHDFDVLFNNSGEIVKCHKYKTFQDGLIKDHYYPSVLGVGYIGVGQYNSDSVIKDMKPYCIWKSMMTRCYSERMKDSSYKEVTVNNEWHNYQIFAEWCEQNYYKVTDQRMHLDKDLLKKNNKEYNSTACCFLPQEINRTIITERIPTRDLPPGVQYKRNKNELKYQVIFQCQRLNKVHSIITNTPEEAFAFYKKEKEAYIKYVADIYKNQIPQKIYDALYAYEVEITD